MTEKQLEGIVKFMLMFENTDIPIKAINNAYGLNLSETTSREEALKKYLEASNIVMDDQDAPEVETENKITLEITAKGWTKTALVDGETKIVVWELTPLGARSVTCDLEEDETVSDELYHALDSLDGYTAARYLEILEVS